MTPYATPLRADPAQTYRTMGIASRAAGSDPHQLVGLMFEELLAALGAAAWAVEQDRPTVRAERVTRALSILFALEAGLDFDKGGDLSVTLSRLYHGARAKLLDAAVMNDPAPYRAVAANLSGIAEAWESLRAA